MRNPSSSSSYELIGAQKGLGRSGTIASLLQRGTDVGDCMVVHHYMAHSGDDSSLFLASHLLHAYLRRNRKEDGRRFFAQMHDRNVYSWNHLIGSNAWGPPDDDEDDRCADGIVSPAECFDRMREESVLPNKTTFVSIVCSRCIHRQERSIRWRAQIARMHARIEGCAEHRHDAVLRTSLLKLYARSGGLEDAWLVFGAMAERDVVTWTTLIACVAEKGHARESLELFHRMQAEEAMASPSIVTFVAILAEYARHAAREEGRVIHYHILAADGLESDLAVDGLESDLAIGNALVNMYGKCGDERGAIWVFDQILARNVVTWTSLITLYAHRGHGKAALAAFDRMLCEGTLPNSVALLNLVVSCACNAVLIEGRRLHARIIARDACDESDLVIAASLVNMYDKCGSVSESRRVFDGAHRRRDLVLWNAMISVYAQNGKATEAIELFEGMKSEGISRPDSATFCSLFSVCADAAEQAAGERMHSYIMESGLAPESIVGNSLVHMYANCDDSLDRATAVFDGLTDRDVVSWSVMIAAYALHGRYDRSVGAFEQMQAEGILPDRITFLSLLDASSASSSSSSSSWGASDCNNLRCIEARVARSGFELDIGVQNALMNSCGRRPDGLVEAEGIFEAMPCRDAASWNTLTALHNEHGVDPEKALDAFRQMHLDQSAVPDKITLINLLSICARVASLDRGRAICTWAIEDGRCEDVSGADLMASMMIAMYAKCGAIDDAEWCFGSIDAGGRSLQTWNAMMGAYSRHGRGRSTIQLFAAMMRQTRSTVVPDKLSFLALLLACSHDGRADDGQKVLMSMLDLCGSPPCHNHYACVLDLLGRAGRAEEALALAMHAMPVQPSGQQFKCVLSNACCWASSGAELVAAHVVESGLLT